MNSRIIQRTFN